MTEGVETNYAGSYLPYLEAGYSPLPIKENDKRPPMSKWQRFCSAPPTAAEASGWASRYDRHGIGLALGVVLFEDMQIVAIDVDDDTQVDMVRAAMGRTPCGKIGAKGITFFALAEVSLKPSKIKPYVIGDSGRRKRSQFPAVEILGLGNQTVIPPTLHPQTRKPYYWVGTPLLEVEFRDLPILTTEIISEIRAVVEGSGRCFIELNEMLWAGESGGGDTHDTCVAAVAAMTARGWDDEAIVDRILRAKAEACERAGEKLDWPKGPDVIKEWIESAKEKGMIAAPETRRVPPERKMAEFLIKRLGKAVSVGGVIRYYAQGHWPELDIESARRILYEQDETLKRREALDALNIMADILDNKQFGTTAGTEPRLDPKRQRICLTNGTLNLISGELEEHSSDHELLHQLEIAWDKSSECPVYDAVVEATFASDAQSQGLWDEWCGLSLVADNSFQKLLFLMGPGGNGKGTLSRVLRDMHAPSAVGSVAITELGDERKRTSLVGKLINISGEQSYLSKVSDAYLKKITGEDPVDVRYLYGETKNNVVLPVRFLEMVNEMPNTSDTSDAFRRRIIILDTPNRPARVDLNLGRKLAAEHAGILRRWVSALARLYARGHFEEPQASQDAVSLYLLESNPVALWISECCETDPAKLNGGTPQPELFCQFREWYRESGHTGQFSSALWGRRMNSLGYPPKLKVSNGESHRMRAIELRSGARY